MNNKGVSYEQEIDIVDVLVRMLRSWKKVVIAAVVGAVVFGGISFLNNRNPEPVLVMTEEQIAEAEAKITELEASITANNDALAANAVAISDLEKSIGTNKTAISDKQTEIKRIELSIEEMEGLKKIYQQAVDALLATEEIEETFASDIISFTTKIADTQHAISENKSKILTLNKDIENLTTANDTTIPSKIEELKAVPQKLEASTASINEQIAALRTEITATITPEMDVKNIILIAVAGLFVGMLAIFGYIAVPMVLDNKIHTAKSLEDSFGLHILGSVRKEEENTKKSLLDKWIGKLTGANRRLNASEEKAVMAAKLQTLSKTKKVMAIGTIHADYLQNAVEELKGAFSEDGFEIVAAGNPMQSPEIMNELKNYELVLVEKVDETNMKDLAVLLQFLHISGSAVLGVIVY